MPRYAAFSVNFLVIITGAIAFVLAFFGCCGSWYQNRCMLLTVSSFWHEHKTRSGNSHFQYFILLVCLFILEFTVGSLTFVFHDSIAHTVKQELRDGIRFHYNASSEGTTGLALIWDQIQDEVIDYKSCEVWKLNDGIDFRRFSSNRITIQ